MEKSNTKKREKKRQLPQLTQVEIQKFTLVALVAKIKLSKTGKYTTQKNDKKNGHLP